MLMCIYIECENSTTKVIIVHIRTARRALYLRHEQKKEKYFTQDPPNTRPYLSYLNIHIAKKRQQKFCVSRNIIVDRIASVSAEKSFLLFLSLWYLQ